jgi:hypothetical protein
MNGITRTRHFDHRFQQRGLNATIIEMLLNYGVRRRTRDGAESLSFTKDVLHEIRTDLGDTVFKACERLRNAYLVVADDGMLITVARSYRRTVH